MCGIGQLIRRYGFNVGDTIPTQSILSQLLNYSGRTPHCCFMTSEILETGINDKEQWIQAPVTTAAEHRLPSLLPRLLFPHGRENLHYFHRSLGNVNELEFNTEFLSYFHINC
ncbi:hypothetical protein J6590_057545 [Homalodisca vitripennis]|nr:hypothetical protein J6590_057545 [Homalodisca vitripennis]